MGRIFSWEYGRLFGMHNPFASAVAKAKDPYIKMRTLTAAARKPLPGLEKTAVLAGIAGKFARPLSPDEWAVLRTELSKPMLAIVCENCADVHFKNQDYFRQLVAGLTYEETRWTYSSAAAQSRLKDSLLLLLVSVKFAPSANRAQTDAITDNLVHRLSRPLSTLEQDVVCQEFSRERLADCLSKCEVVHEHNRESVTRMLARLGPEYDRAIGGQARNWFVLSQIAARSVPADRLQGASNEEVDRILSSGTESAETKFAYLNARLRVRVLEWQEMQVFSGHGYLYSQPGGATKASFDIDGPAAERIEWALGSLPEEERLANLLKGSKLGGFLDYRDGDLLGVKTHYGDWFVPGSGSIMGARTIEWVKPERYI